MRRCSGASGTMSPRRTSTRCRTRPRRRSRRRSASVSPDGPTRGWRRTGRRTPKPTISSSAASSWSSRAPKPACARRSTLFERAAALDSTYADPWNGIAQAWFFLADTYLAPRAAVPPMRAAIDKALALDPTSAWAHALHGSLLTTYVRDYPAGEREYLTATALDSTSPFAGRLWLAAARARPGRFGPGGGAPRAAAQSLCLRADESGGRPSSAIWGCSTARPPPARRSGGWRPTPAMSAC